ncbi:MAG TPA: CocE/NonD family hydrolase [Caldimonas sp.]
MLRTLSTRASTTPIKDASMPSPLMIVRTPFGVDPYGSDEYSAASAQTAAFLKAGYIWVRQDVCGRRMSEGSFVSMTPHRPEKRAPADVDESADTTCCRRFVVDPDIRAQGTRPVAAIRPFQGSH